MGCLLSHFKFSSPNELIYRRDHKCYEITKRNTICRNSCYGNHCLCYVHYRIIHKKIIKFIDMPPEMIGIIVQFL